MTAVSLDDMRAFVTERIAPCAAEWDRAGEIDRGLVAGLAAEGMLTAALPVEYGGSGMGAEAFGRLCEEVGAACSSTRSLLTVQDLVAGTLLRWGTDDQRSRWVPPIASGHAVAGFCLTEPLVGSDGAAVQSELRTAGDGWRLSGTKCWVTFGAHADLFLVIARSDVGPTAVVVERSARGVDVVPVGGQLGLRAASLATVRFEDVQIERSQVVGRTGAGVAVIAATALDRGRFSVAWGCVGIARACADASISYATCRTQFGSPLIEHQLVRRMISDTFVDVQAARLLCVDAAAARDARSPDAIAKTVMAKYFAARDLVRIASDAVQIHGANGISGDFPVERLLRDAKVMQIIEGSDQMHQLAIAGFAARGRRGGA